MRFTLSISMCDPSHYLPLAIEADRWGWDGVVVPDSPFYPETVSAPYPYSSTGERYWGAEVPQLEPWVVIPAMAAVTTRLRFFPGVLKLPIRNPLLVAKTIGSAAVLSGNRIACGIGVSWMPEEFLWCGQDYASRGARTDEAIEIIRALLSGGMVEHHGPHYDFDRLQMSPAPTASVPLIVGGMSARALRRAARLGDGWYAIATDPVEIETLVKRVLEERAALGGTDDFAIFGRTTDMANLDDYRRLRDIGVTDAVVKVSGLYGASNDMLSEKIDAVRRLAEEMFDAFSDGATR